MNFLAGLLPTGGLAEYARLAFVALVAGLLCLNLGQCQGRNAERARQNAARAEANVEAMTRDQGARDRAAEQRVRDATEVTANEERLIDAIEDTPDTAPDPTRVRLGCERLRAAGTDTASIAACR